jgi:hypothetical protein
VTIFLSIVSSELWSLSGTSYRIFIEGLKSYPRSGFHEFEKSYSKRKQERYFSTGFWMKNALGNSRKDSIFYL